MKKVSSILLLLICILGIAACSNEPETYDYEPEPESLIIAGSNITGALHRVEYGNNVAYLFGTIHGGHPHWFPLACIVEDALRHADIIAVEVEEIADPAAFNDIITALTFLPDGLTWAEYLPEPEYNHLVEMAEAWGLMYSAVNTMNPAMLVHTLVINTVASLSEFDLGLGASVDAYIATVAKELGLPVIGLESSVQQTEILFNPPRDVMLAQVIALIPPNDLIHYLVYETYELALDELAYFYERNDFDAINQSFARTLGSHIDDLFVTYMREIVANWRSTYYAHAIIRLLQETKEPTTFFVAVGLSHINRSSAGEEFTDIVQQLEIAGFAPVPLY